MLTEKVVAYGTGIRHTRILSEHTGNDAPALWERTAPHPDHPFSAVPSGLSAALRERLPLGGPRFVIGGDEPTLRRYPMPASASLAGLVLDARRTGLPWPQIYRDLGLLLAALHGAGRERAELVPDTEPDARLRLRRWWQVDTRARTGPGHDFRAGLDENARALLDRILSTELHGTLVHGWIGQGVLALAPDGDLHCLLGEDLGAAPPEYDLGALIAQAVELAVFSPPGSVAPPATCRDALLDGYRSGGGQVEDDLLDDHTIEHVARHVCDFVQFAPFDPAELPRWSRLIGWLANNRNAS